jgi:hypothetical protein
MEHFPFLFFLMIAHNFYRYLFKKLKKNNQCRLSKEIADSRSPAPLTMEGAFLCQL